jgi:hypothetical protein
MLYAVAEEAAVNMPSVYFQLLILEYPKSLPLVQAEQQAQQAEILEELGAIHLLGL